jgi:hypothetical protein
MSNRSTDVNETQPCEHGFEPNRPVRRPDSGNWPISSVGRPFKRADVVRDSIIVALQESISLILGSLVPLPLNFPISPNSALLHFWTFALLILPVILYYFLISKLLYFMVRVEARDRALVPNWSRG